MGRVSNRLMTVKLVFGNETMHIASTYTPQVGLLEAEKSLFWEDLKNLIQLIFIDENIYFALWGS